MSIRPIDLQQVIMRASDVGRDVSNPQQAAAAQHTQAAEQTKRHAERAETVQQFDESGTVLIRDRQSSSDQPDEEKDEAHKEPPSEDEAQASVEPMPGTTRPPLGRHIDLQI